MSTMGWKAYFHPSFGTATYMLTVTNNGPDRVTNAFVTDVPGAGQTSPPGNTVTITGNGIPAGNFTEVNLTGVEIVLGILNVGQSAVLTFAGNVP